MIFDPENAPLRTLASVLLLSMAGGAASFLARWRAGQLRLHWVAEFTLDALYATTAGLASYHLACAYGLNEHLTIAAVAVSGHLGARFVALVQQAMLKRMGLGLAPPSPGGPGNGNGNGKADHVVRYSRDDREDDYY